jgi:hypothetical protein
MHPLAPDLTQLKDEDLHKKLSDLTQRLTISYKQANYALAGQLHMLIDDYQNEVNRRQQKMLEELASKNDKFNGIIDIK